MHESKTDRAIKRIEKSTNPSQVLILLTQQLIKKVERISARIKKI